MAAIARAASHKLNIPLYEGVYMWTTGPTYETPAEVQVINHTTACANLA